MPDLLSKLRNCASITIGINLNADFIPVSAVLVSVNEKKFKGSSVFKKMLGINNDPFKGISELHTPPKDETEIITGIGPMKIPGNNKNNKEPVLFPLFKDLSEVMNSICKPVD